MIATRSQPVGHLRICVLLVSTACMIGSSVFAGDSLTPLPPVSPAFKVPRPPVTQPLAPPPEDAYDLHGVWWPVAIQPELSPMGTSTRPPLTPIGQRILAHRLAMKNLGTPVPDAAVLCRPMGPRVLTSPYPQEIFQSPHQIVFLFEENHIVQRVELNSQHPHGLKPSYQGHSIGYWQGETLYIDTVGYNASTWLDSGGTPHSDQLHLTQRLRKTDHNTKIEETVTISDPVIFTRPWSYQVIFDWRPDTVTEEYTCETSMRDAKLQANHKDLSLQDARSALGQ